MRRLWVLALGLAALTAVSGCKRKTPEPIPGPKAAAMIGHGGASAIVYFQGSLDEAFARPGAPAHSSTCDAERAPMAPVAPDLSRNRARPIPPAPPAACRGGNCPQVTYPRRPLV